jgi:hypothetical protein
LAWTVLAAFHWRSLPSEEFEGRGMRCERSGLIHEVTCQSATPLENLRASGPFCRELCDKLEK